LYLCKERKTKEYQHITKIGGWKENRIHNRLKINEYNSIMVKIENKAKDNPKLGQKTLNDGRISLHLEYYMGRVQTPVIDEQTGEQATYKSGKMRGKLMYQVKHDRKTESLNLYLIDKPRTPIEREQNRKVLEIAEEIRTEREQELKQDRTGKRIFTKQVNFLDFFQSYIDTYKKKDIRMIQGAYRRFKDFLSIEYPLYSNSLKPQQLNKNMIEAFVEYLESKSIGEGARGYFQRFKKVIANAEEKGLITKNPCKGVICQIDENILRKDILSVDEMEKLIQTTYRGQNEEIRRAFIFSLYTGIRFCDVIEMKYSNVDYSNKILSFEQAKTKKKSANSGVVIPLNEGLLSLIGEKPEKDDFIFHLPSSTMCLKALDRWVKRAGIDKHITWHCARHSFAVNILNNGANIKTVASLLGHSGLKHTEKYTRAVDSLKEKAINSLPEFKL